MDFGSDEEHIAAFILFVWANIIRAEMKRVIGKLRVSKVRKRMLWSKENSLHLDQMAEKNMLGLIIIFWNQPSS